MEQPVIDVDGDVKLINGAALLADTLLLVGFGLIGGVFIPQIGGTFHRGFFCNDQSIQYQYKGDTVTPTVLVLYCFFVMTVAVVATECYRARKESPAFAPRYRLGKTPIHCVVVRIVTYFAYAQIGLVCVYVLTNITKNCVGRLRPHFLDVCKPLDITCHKDEFYNNYVCSGDPSKVEEARKSFFSGHSSLSMYASTFTALYLLARVPRYATSRVAIPVMQTVLIAAGLLISLSRINDNKHHWSDVIVGIFVGVFTAAYTCLVWARMFVKNDEEVLPLRGRHLEYMDGSGATERTEDYSEQKQLNHHEMEGASTVRP